MKQTQQKSSKDETSPWMKWAYVGVALLVAVAMVGTYLAPLLDAPRNAQVGNTALIGYTIRGEDGRPLVTTNQNLAASEYEKNNLVFLTGNLEIPVGTLSSEGVEIVPIPVVYPTDAPNFGLMGFELGALSQGLVGMRVGETRTVSLGAGANDLALTLSREDADEIGLNFTEIEVGDVFLREFMVSSGVPVGNQTNQTSALRFWKVSEKTSDSAIVTCRYGNAEVTLNGITG
ncbi:hypothetical protein F8E02_00765 [Methanoculleus sp. Wushi-C6]|uniref:Peptidylprolyl isomerase n=1 Tax=Methanoculleus caldifontis TaxID=2651577 RepID=A0ABU3WYC3_9EURY|nr:hypothetical protein [Methanoculleus sp. Wushi-C6]MDV2480560.1 hypothetical protein [Methanoculleus sp. Wushi-C6]